MVVTPVVATASGDKALSIWIGSNARPVVVMQDLANKAFTDLAWSPDGLCLFATALDGSILLVKFEESDIGHVVPLDENERVLAKFKSSKKGVGVAESANVLLLEEKSKAGEQKNVEGRMGALMGDHHMEMEGIQSTSISTGPITTGSSQPTTEQTGEASSSAAPRPTSSSGDKNKENENPTDDTSEEKKEAERLKEAEKIEQARQQQIERLKQKPTYTKEGKKRIQPMLISTSSGAASTLNQSRLITQSSATISRGNYEPEAALDLSKPYDRLPKGGLPALLFGNKRKYAGVDDDEQKRAERRVRRAAANGAVPILRHDSEGHLLPAEAASTDSAHAEPVPEFIRPAIVNPSTSVSMLRLAVPKIRTVVSLGIDQSGNPTDPTGKTPSAPRVDVVLEIKNPQAHTPKDMKDTARVFLFKGDQILWQDFLERPAVLATGNKKLWAAACDDGTIYIWTPAGRRLLNALQLESAPVILECMDSWILAITSVGMCYVWNITTLSSPHPPVSLAPVLDAAVRFIKPEASRAPSINGARINSEGRIVVVLSNGDAYSYSPMLYIWQRMSETWWACTSQYWNTTDSSVGNIRSSRMSMGGGAAGDINEEQERKRRILSAGIIPYMERNTTTELLKHGRGSTLQNLLRLLVSGQHEDYELFERLSSVAHLENRVAAALSLGAKEEFRIYLSMYAKRLGAEGFKERAEELMENILGGIFEDEEDANRAKTRRRIGKLPEGRMWMEGSETLCGWDRKELLTEVVLALGKHRDFQRVTLPYAQLLGIFDDDNASRDSDIAMIA